jgi:hypothetical protein
MDDPGAGDHALLARSALPACAEYGLAVSGGYAIRAHGLVERSSQDIDFATAAMGALHDRGLPRDLLDVHGAAAHFSGPELISLCRAALDDEFNLETLRDQLSYAAAYPDEAFTRYGCAPVQIADVKAWAQDWSAKISHYGRPLRA